MFDSDKKRKLQYDQLVLPLPKHKFGEKSYGFDRESSIDTCLQTTEDLLTVLHECSTERSTDEGPEQSEDSVNDSTMLVVGYDPAMIPADRGKTVVSFGNESPNDRSSTSSNSSDAKNFKDPHYSLNSRSIIHSKGKARTSLVHGGNQLLEFGANEDYVASVFEDDDIGQSIMGAEGLMLYTNDVTLSGAVISPDRWSKREDARPAGRKPTIDQEFEQYFSMLML